MTKEQLNELSLEEFTEKIRDAVLWALDMEMPDFKGWVDADLKDLFPAIDTHAKKLYERRKTK
jgi:hypothetical protein